MLSEHTEMAIVVAVLSYVIVVVVDRQTLLVITYL